MTVEDREAIRELLHGYCLCVDSGDADKWVDLFTDDATFTVQRGSFGIEGPVTGRAALHRLASGFRADGLHFSSNAVIDVQGDEATVTSYVLVLQGTDDPNVRLGGRYQDQLRRVDGRWRFASRQLVAQMQRPLP